MGGFNTLFSNLCISSKQKIIKKHTFFSAVHGGISKTDHLTQHKSSLNKYKKEGVILYALSDNNETKLETSNKRYYRS